MDDAALWKRKYERERSARLEAERISEKKTRESWRINEELRRLNLHLEELVKLRTADLAKARDEAIEANRVKSRFLANISHELRTPLNAIIGYGEVLCEELQHLPGTAADLQKIYLSGKHLLALINEMLDLSQMEADKPELRIEPCSVEQICSGLQASIEPLVLRNRNHVELRLTPGYLETDLAQLRRILLNLLGNACKFTEGGTITLTVAASAVGGREGYCFIVADNGIGMSEDQLEKLFQPFTQADASAARKYGGTGLGLAISAKLVNLLGGTIEVKSIPGSGSEFRLWLPRQPEAEVRSYISTSQALG